MIPPRGWRDRQARARSRYGRNVTSDPAVAAERARIYALREAELAEQAAAVPPTPVAPVTVAQMIPSDVPVIDDVTPDEDEPEAPAAPEADEPAPEAPAPAPEPAPETPAAPVEPPAPAPKPAAPKKAAKAPAKKS